MKEGQKVKSNFWTLKLKNSSKAFRLTFYFGLSRLETHDKIHTSIFILHGWELIRIYPWNPSSYVNIQLIYLCV